MKKLLLFLALAFCLNIHAQIINTIAGVNQVRGNGGIGGLADTTKLDHPASIITDAAGNMYMAVGNVVRKINTAGIISAYAGTGLGTFTSSVQDSGDGGQATAAQLSFPNGLAFDAAGNFYIADSYNHKIRVVNTAGIINTFAGTTQGYG